MWREWKNLENSKAFYSVMGKENICAKAKGKLLDLQHFMCKSIFSQNKLSDNKETDLYTFVFLEDETT